MTIHYPVCSNCDYEGDVGKTLCEIHHLGQRLEDNDTVPAGECPKCGCFMYFKDVPDPALVAEGRRLVDQHIAKDSAVTYGIVMDWLDGDGSFQNLAALLDLAAGATPTNDEKKQIVVFAITNDKGEYFCGGKGHRQKSDFSPDLRRARFYHTTSIVKGQVSTNDSVGKKKYKAVRLTLTIEKQEDVE